MLGRRVLGLVPLLLVLAASAPTAAGGAPPDCEVQSPPAIEVLPGIYFSFTYLHVPGSTDADVWLEDNGVAGLQRGSTLCPDGRWIERDLPVIAEIVTDPLRILRALPAASTDAGGLVPILA